MKLFTLTCIFLFGCFFAEAQIGRADSLFQQSNYQLAAVFYEKAAFEETDVYRQSVCLLKKAYCYKAMGDYGQALEITGRMMKVHDDSLKRKVNYERILLAYLEEDYQLTYNELLKWDLAFHDDPLVLPYRFLTLVSLDKIDEAKALLVKQYEYFGLSEEEATSFFPEKWKLKNPQKAYNLSLFLPGVGQMYSGYFLRGLFSGGIQAVLIVFTGYNLYHGYFFTGGMTGAAFFYTFYLGGARYARQLAEIRNDEMKGEIKEKFLRIIKKEDSM